MALPTTTRDPSSEQSSKGGFRVCRVGGKKSGITPRGLLEVVIGFDGMFIRDKCFPYLEGRGT